MISGTVTRVKWRCTGAPGSAGHLGLRLQGGAEDAGLRGLVEGGVAGGARRAALSRERRPLQSSSTCRRLPCWRSRWGSLPLAIAKMVWFFSSVALLVALAVDGGQASVERRKICALARRRDRHPLCEVLRARARARPGQPAVRGHRRRRPSWRCERGARRSPARSSPSPIVVKPYAMLFLPWLIARRQLPLDRLGVRRPRPRPRPAGGALRVGRQRRAASRVVADGHGDDRAQPVDPRQRVARGDVLPLARSGVLAARSRTAPALRPAAAWPRSSSSCRRRRAFPEGLEGALLLTLMPLLSPQGWDYVFLIATPAIVLSRELPRSPAAAAAVHHDCRHRDDRLQPLRPDGRDRRTTRSCGCRSSACVSSS